MSQFEFGSVSGVIRQVMKSQGFTYETLAKRMGMSGSGLKKLLAAEDCSLARLSSLCSLLRIELGDLLKSSTEIKSTEIKFTKSQEEFLLKNPGHFFFFWELIEGGMTVAKLRAQYGLDDKSVRKYLSALDKIGLIELHPGDEVKHRYAGKTHWNMGDSPLGQMAMNEFHGGFLRRLRASADNSKVNRRRVNRWINFSLKKKTYEEFVDASHALANEFIARAAREKPLCDPNELLPVGALLGIMEFRYPEIIKIPKI